MRLTSRCGNYAKRIKPLSKVLAKYFFISENEARLSVNDIAPVVRYFKVKKIYLTCYNSKIEVSTKLDSNTCCIELDTRIEDGSVCCENNITLWFPSIL